MAYSDFTLAVLEEQFGLRISHGADLYSGIAEADLPASLDGVLRRYLPMAINLTTEKARSELLIAPMLFEFNWLHRDRVAVFSGVDFTVDEARGLRGWCDFLVSREPNQLAVAAPVCALVEAKNENIVGGIPQCLAEMVAAQLFNAAKGKPVTAVHGIVSTGLRWRFLRLEGVQASIDAAEYSIENAREIFGILTHVVLGA